MYQDYLNQIVLVRSIEAGVYFGTLTEVDGKSCRLENVRNIWRWEGANTLSQVATDGIGKDSKVSGEVSSMVLTGVCQLLPLTKKALKCLKSIKPWEA